MPRYVGKGIKRIEDYRILMGNGRYVDDVNMPGMLYMAVLRSPVPHAKITKVDVSDALRLNGVISAFTGLTIKVENRPRNFPMARDEALYVGHPIAAILAVDRYIAHDALELIQFDYEPLPAIVDPEKAINNDAKAIEDMSNIGYSKQYLSGDPEKALRESEVIIEEKLELARIYPGFMEPRGIVVVPQGNELTVYASTQAPHYMRKYLLSAFGSRVNDIRVIQTDVGGAFGGKMFPYPEEYMAVKASLDTGRPVKWVATRREDMMSTYHARGQIHNVRAGFTRSGEWKGIVDELIIDLGAATHGYYLADIAATLVTGPYRVRDVKVNIKGVRTNKTPLDQYRGAGRPEASFIYERIMDLAAREIGMDPIEIRRKNLVKDLPYINPLGHRYDSGNYFNLLATAEKYYREFKERAMQLRKQGEKAGVGLGFYIEQNGFGPWESISIRLKSNGKVLAIIGAAPHGQGDATAIAQIIAEELGIDMEKISVMWGDTALIGEGFGTFGSRTLTLAGNAAIIAANRLKEKIRLLGAQLMGVNEEEVIYRDGKIIHVASGKSLAIDEIADRVTTDVGGLWKLRAEPSLEAEAYFGLKDYLYPYGAHVALVRITAEGLVKVLDYVAIDDVGTVVNPLLAEGQVIGGVIQGFGEATLEEVKYDEEGNLMTQGFSEYWLPSSMESFRVKWVYMEDGKSNTPLQSKGIAEGPLIGALPALASAIENAAGRKVTRLPISPEELI